MKSPIDMHVSGRNLASVREIWVFCTGFAAVRGLHFELGARAFAIPLGPVLQPQIDLLAYLQWAPLLCD